MKLGNHAVFITGDAVAELNGVGEQWMRDGESGVYFLCKSVNTDGAFTHIEFEDEVVPGDMHLKIPHRYIRAILFGETLENFGFIRNYEK